MSETPEENFDDETVDDIEIYEGLPELDVPRTNENGDQDDEIPLGGGLSLLARTAAVRTTPETLAWYRTHQFGGQIGFDPDGVCLKVCRTARNIGPKFLTARQAQLATPEQHRVHRVRDLRKGMVVFFDDVNDSNRAGHIVTLIGRVAGFDPDSLDDILVETNSVVANEVVVVRGSYFQIHWGDEYQFGATWLNGVVFDIGEKESLIEHFQDGGPVYRLNLLARAGEDRPAAKRVLDGIMTQVNGLPDNPKLFRIKEFKAKVRSGEKLLDMSLLNKAVEERGNRPGRIMAARDEIRRLIESLPDE